VNTFTLFVFLGFWPAWLVWELVLLRLRALPGDKPKTISMVARDRGYQLNVVVYLWGGLATHFWWLGSTWATVPGAIAFWVLPLLLLVADIVLWNWPRESWPPWLRFARQPLLWLVVGALAGRFLFPQSA
jgi:hypothetical protein